jgi:hypothetical protein
MSNRLGGSNVELGGVVASQSDFNALSLHKSLQFPCSPAASIPRRGALGR